MCAPARRSVYVQLPVEDAEEGKCGRLNMSMYGTRNAAQNWEYKFTEFMINNGFKQRKSSPCAFHMAERDLALVVCGDDFPFCGADKDLDWITNRMAEEFEVKVRGRLGPEPKDGKEIIILNRIVKWTSKGIKYEADPRHAELIVDMLGLKNCSPVTTPGVKQEPDPESPDLPPEEASRYRAIVARGNYLSQDRTDIQLATGHLSEGMSKPTRQDIEKLTRLGRYLAGRSRYVIKFGYQKDVWAINCFTDADWAGDVKTEKSTSAGNTCLGDHMCSSWSMTQTVIALSSGESEFSDLSLCAARSLGFQSLLADLGVILKLRILPDATTGMAIASRRGLGKLRHISTHELWIQEHISRESPAGKDQESVQSN